MTWALIPSRHEAGQALAGLFYLMLKRPEGLKLFDTTPVGFWRSFGAFVWTWPVQCFLWTGVWRAVPETRPDGAAETLGFFLVSGGFDLAAWLIPSILLLAVSQLFGLGDKFARLVVVSNWYGLFSVYVGFFPAALRYLAPVPDVLSATLSLIAYMAVIGLYFRVIRGCLEGEVLISVFITLMMVMTGLTISELAFTALGG
ncbi:hypothetical protein OEG84_18150 [Hoeflea sp. G2-23]|uniref:Yip1 domain-containing protein n=1 Tax=Hoeflea algicola TaxID=2983763 RepID=A0ABT3ZCR0_9HYPH|nr:hypothetical protein [Hoeflea algicola]MCY0149576.1 hypothetical protein [Hoeflea algicola]